jgi:hypothetical protein
MPPVCAGAPDCLTRKVEIATLECVDWSSDRRVSARLKRFWL